MKIVCFVVLFVVMKVTLIYLLLIGINIFINNSIACESIAKTYEFPENFKFGAASAAYQIEGAWNEDGKDASIWDTFTHNHPEFIFDSSNGDVSADSYHHYLDDVAALKQIGVK